MAVLLGLGSPGLLSASFLGTFGSIFHAHLSPPVAVKHLPILAGGTPMCSGALMRTEGPSSVGSSTRTSFLTALSAILETLLPVKASSGHLALGQEASEGETRLAGMGGTEISQLCAEDVPRDKLDGITIKLRC